MINSQFSVMSGTTTPDLSSNANDVQSAVTPSAVSRPSYAMCRLRDLSTAEQRFILWIILMIIFIPGCGDPPPEEGYVREKKFEEAHWEGGYESFTNYGYTCGMDFEGEYSCGIRQYTDQRWEDHHTYVDDRWSLRLEFCEQKDGKEKCRDGWKRVDETTYHKYEINNYYPQPR